MQKNIIYSTLIISVLLFSCNNNSGKTDDAAKNNAAPTVTEPAKNETSDNGINASFMLNGQPANTTGGDKDASGKHSGIFFAKDKTLNVFILGFIAPDTYRHQMMISVKNFTPGTTGVVTNATAQFARKDETKREFIYGNRKEGVFKLTIAKWEAVNSGPLVKAVISGTFEGDMDCETCFDAAIKNSPFSQTQHITAGKFENIRVSFMQ